VLETALLLPQLLQLLLLRFGLKQPWPAFAPVLFARGEREVVVVRGELFGESVFDRRLFAVAERDTGAVASAPRISRFPASGEACGEFFGEFFGEFLGEAFGETFGEFLGEGEFFREAAGDVGGVEGGDGCKMLNRSPRDSPKSLWRAFTHNFICSSVSMAISNFWLSRVIFSVFSPIRAVMVLTSSKLTTPLGFTPESRSSVLVKY